MFEFRFTFFLTRNYEQNKKNNNTKNDEIMQTNNTAIIFIYIFYDIYNIYLYMSTRKDTKFFIQFYLISFKRINMAK